MNPLEPIHEIVISASELIEKYVQLLESKMLAKYPGLKTYKPLGVKA